MEEQSEEEKIETFEEKFQNFIGTAKEEVSSLKAELNDITELYSDFVKKPSTAVLSKAERLNETFEKVNEYNSEISSIEEKVSDFETKVFGKTPEDKESLKFKLNDLKTQHEELHGEWEGNFETLTAKIEGLLPGATSAGLAQSYFEQKNSNCKKIF
jgi:chromosome segregation ATPase